jgi:GTPase-activating protein SAC7
MWRILERKRLVRRCIKCIHDNKLTERPATDVEGIFRLAGSEKRIKELKIQFDSPDRYGKGLDWTGYTVHDAANILRRYFNQLPEPIIPLSFYERFREPLRNHQAQAVGPLEAQSPSVGQFDQTDAIQKYQTLITELPPLNKQLLLYILDLLAVFASKSDLNKMTTANLSAIFQPGILSHPQHDMSPPDYRLSQDVLIFLIDNQDHFLIGMQGTEAPPETVRDVQSGSPSRVPGTPTTPSRSKTIVGRSTSNASAGAESVGKFGSIRRNVSLSSKKSKRSDGGPTIVAGVVTDPGTPTSGVYRSNTVPSRRGGSNANSPRFPRDKNSDPNTPSPGNSSTHASEAPKGRQESLQSTPVATAAPQFPSTADATTNSSEATTPLARVASEASSALTREYQTPKKDTTPLLSPPGGSADRMTERSVSGTPSTGSGRAFLDIFKQSPGSDDGRRPNKLQKKRIPGSALSSAQSSNHSLTHDGQQDAPPRSPITSNFAAAAAVVASENAEQNISSQNTSTGPSVTGLHAPPELQRRISGEQTLRPTVSPPQSYHSANESDADMVGDDMPKEQVQQTEKPKRKHRSWFSRTQNKIESPAQQPPNPLGTMTPQDQAMSRSTVGSTGPAQPRRSFQEPTPITPSATDPAAGSSFGSPQMQPVATDPVFSDSERERRGPISWIRGKFKDGKDKDDKRARTPERNRGSRQDLSLSAEATTPRGKSFDRQRLGSESGSLPPQPGSPPQQPQLQPPINLSPKSGSSPHAVTAAQVAVGANAANPGVQTQAPVEGLAAQTQVPVGEVRKEDEPAPEPTVPLATNGTSAIIGQAATEKDERRS